MDKITQDMKYRYSLVRYALSQGVCKASRKYNKGRSYIYFWIKRFDGEISSLASKSRRPKHHPLEHSQDEIELIRRYWSHNRELGLFELWFKLRNQGYNRHYVSLYRVMRREGLGRQKAANKTKYKPKPYEPDALCWAESASRCQSSARGMCSGQRLEALLPIHGHR